jgi:uncharacterized surface protein with fasciclin (FAS1) repeats
MDKFVTNYGKNECKTEHRAYYRVNEAIPAHSPGKNKTVYLMKEEESEMFTKLTKLFSLILVFVLVTGAASTLAAPAPQASSQQDIVDIAVADGRFTTLVTALEAAGLVETLQGEGPFTVFAPTDEAFAKLPAGALDSLLADPEA